MHACRNGIQVKWKHTCIYSYTPLLALTEQVYIYISFNIGGGAPNARPHPRPTSDGSSPATCKS